MVTPIEAKTSVMTEPERVGKQQNLFQNRRVDVVFRVDLLCAAIFTYLPIKDILRGEAVSSQFHKTSQSYLLWETKSKEIGINPSTIKKYYLRRICIQTIQKRSEILEKAFQTANRVRPPALQVDAHSDIAKARAQTDTPGEFNTVNQIENPEFNANAYLAMAQTDLPQALQRADQIEDFINKAEVYLVIAKIQNQIDPRDAADTYQKALQTADQIQAPYDKVILYLKIAAFYLPIHKQAQELNLGNAKAPEIGRSHFSF